MEISFTIEGLDNIAKATGRVKKEVDNELQKALLAAAMKVHSEASKSLTDGKKTGRIYRRGKNIVHQASAEGEAPANDTGTLLQSLNFEVTKEKLEAKIFSRLKYAKMLEFGTTKIKPRPFMFPAFEKSKTWIQERLNKAVRDAAIKSVRK